jgi:hypothetical protein
MKGEWLMNNTVKFLALGLVLGGGFGIAVGAMLNNISMGIVFGAGGGLILGLAIGNYLDRRTN